MNETVMELTKQLLPYLLKFLVIVVIVILIKAVYEKLKK